MEPRRASQRPLHLVRVRTQASPADPAVAAHGPLLTEHFLIGPSDDARLSPAPPVDTLSSDTDAAFLLESDSGEPLLIGGTSVRRISKGEGGDDLLARAIEGARRWQHEQDRIRWRCALADHLIAFSRKLNQAVQPKEVYAALSEHVVRIIGGFAVLILVRDPITGVYYALENARVKADLWKLAFVPPAGLLRPGTIGYDDTRVEIAAPFVELAPLFEDGAIVSAAHLPFAGDHLLLLLERRAGRVLDPEEWNLLGALTGHAETALVRIQLFEEMRSLSLTDSLTGLANRRQMNLVLERGLAAARRGQRLTLVLLDIDGFKQINDQLGHQAGDRVLCHVASTLRGLVRGSDLVIRYGGDEFLLVLPEGDASGAKTLVGRIRERLPDTGISAGIAEYERSIRTVDELVNLADRSLLEAKHQKHPAPPAALGTPSLPHA